LLCSMETFCCVPWRYFVVFLGDILLCSMEKFYCVPWRYFVVFLGDILLCSLVLFTYNFVQPV
jgi:hypothetical protein